MTSANEQQLGFEYQYLYFILQLLKMQPGESAGYEVLDDIHTISANNGEVTYIQVKHTINTAKNSVQATLPRLSIDLWKPLSNWSKVITDPAEYRQSIDKQLSFVDSTSFVLVVNRRIHKNDFVTFLAEIQNNRVSEDQIRDYLSNLMNSTSDATIKQLISNVSMLPEHVLESFLKHVTIVNTANNLLKEIQEYIRLKMIPDEYVSDVLSRLYTQLRMDFFDAVQNHKQQVITSDEWTRKYSSVFSVYRTTLLPYRQYQPPLPEHLQDQVFVKELIEIGVFDMSNNGLSEIAEYTKFYLDVQCQLDGWYEDGRITYDQIERFHKDAKLTWKHIHQSSHRSTASNMTHDKENALTCFYHTIKERLMLLSTDIGLELSNGEFIKLANEKQIGWKYHWEGGVN